jgi:hypothetical protein
VLLGGSKQITYTTGTHADKHLQGQSTAWDGTACLGQWSVTTLVLQVQVALGAAYAICGQRLALNSSLAKHITAYSRLTDASV